MRIPVFLAMLVGRDFLEKKLEDIEKEYAAIRERMHSKILGRVCLMYPNEDALKLSKVIETAENELLAPFDEAYREQRRVLRAAIDACG